VVLDLKLLVDQPEAEQLMQVGRPQPKFSQFRLHLFDGLGGLLVYLDE